MSYKIQFSQWLMHQLQQAGATADSCEILHPLVLTIGLVVLIAIADFVSRKVILTVVARYAKKSNNTYDDILVEMRVFIYLAHVVPALVAKKGLLFIFNENSDWVNILQHLIDAYIIIAIIRHTFGCFEPEEKNDISDEALQLAKKRDAVRAEKNFAESDRIRDALIAMGYINPDIAIFCSA